MEVAVSVGTAETPLLLRSFRNEEKAEDDRSIRVRSVRRVFSAFSASFSD